MLKKSLLILLSVVGFQGLEAKPSAQDFFSLFRITTDMNFMKQQVDTFLAQGGDLREELLFDLGYGDGIDTVKGNIFEMCIGVFLSIEHYYVEREVELFEYCLLCMDRKDRMPCVQSALKKCLEGSEYVEGSDNDKIDSIDSIINGLQEYLEAYQENIEDYAHNLEEHEEYLTSQRFAWMCQLLIQELKSIKEELLAS